MAKENKLTEEDIFYLQSTLEDKGEIDLAYCPEIVIKLMATRPEVLKVLSDYWNSKKIMEIIINSLS